MGERLAPEGMESVYHATKLVVAAVAVLIPLCSCSTPLRHTSGLPRAETHLLFNPKGTIDSSFEAVVVRADWPATAGLDRPREEISYRETIMDRQGRSWLDEGFTYRRFDSTRTGRTTR